MNSTHSVNNLPGKTDDAGPARIRSVVRVKELSEGKILLKDGSLYPALQKMTSDGLLSFKEEEVGGRVRKYYYLTRQGQKEKTVYVNELKDFIATLNRIVFPELKLYEGNC